MLFTTEGGACVWAKLSDDLDEELAHLSAGAFRLYVAAITYSRRRELGGVLAQRDLDTLVRAQRIPSPERVIVELLDDSEDGPLWTVTDGRFSIRSYDKYNPPTSNERTRKWRHKDSDVTGGDATVTLPRASAPAPGSPVPDPLPVARNGAKAPNPPTPFTEEIRQIFEVEVESRKGTGTIMLTPKREKAGRARLTQGYPLDECFDAVRWGCQDEWCLRTGHSDMSYSLKDGETLEQFRNRWRQRQPTRRQLPPADEERGGEMRPLSEILAAMPGRN